MIKAIVRDWNEFWFAEKSPVPLCLMRILIGIAFLIWGVLMAPPSLYTWYSQTGVMPLSFYHLYRGSAVEICLLDSVTNPQVLLAYWIAYLLFAVTFTVGFCTRISTVLLYLLTLSFNFRNPLILNSGDTMMRCVLFMMIFAPMGASCSIDRLISIGKGKDPGGAPRNEVLWPQRILQVQVSLIYAATLACKLSGKDWLNGTAVYFPIHMDEIARFPLPRFLSTPFMINIFTWGTMFTEGLLATFVWVPRFRPYVLTLGVLLHSGIEYALNIPLFSYIMVSSYLTFVYNDWISAGVGILTKSFSRYRLDVTLPEGMQTNDPWWLVIERLDALHLLHVTALESSSGHDLTVSGRGWESTGEVALRRALLACPICWVFAPLSFLPGADRLLHSYLPKSIGDLSSTNSRQPVSV